ncbi:MAG: multicopper polyphenol oxidase, partial [Candidatus Eisenbacteria bacterium]|nr:multicopper polyphenol oxidase [Candidatus Latescibacterota bacterium]MBD3302409.1 multicopper polyphenol oxidase [Candidatus Eisenbacteria bacterium]
DGIPRLDLRRAIQRRLVACRIPGAAIGLSTLCTACRKDLFFSYRRDGARSGRMAAVFVRDQERTRS